jgi:hypothetical protein
MLLPPECRVWRKLRRGAGDGRMRSFAVIGLLAAAVIIVVLVALLYGDVLRAAT